jgi:PAS domain S-box-containing protein
VPAAAAIDDSCRAILDRLPTGILVYRINTPLYANRAFLAWSGDASLEAFASGGGLDRLFLESGIVTAGEDAKTVTLTADTKRGPAESRLFSVSWEGERAHALVVTPAGAEQRGDRAALRQSRARIRELRAAVNLAADGVAVLDTTGRIVRLNSPAEALFDVDAKSVVGQPFVELLAPENHALATADFEALAADGTARHQGHEVMTRGHDGESIALFMTIGRYDEDGKPRYCAVFRDISLWKHTVRDLLSAKRQAEQASRAKSDFIAKISHEIRTPLNAIIGFSEVMMEERLGPVENERYRAYLKDIHASGEHLVALLNDLLDLSKIEAGKLDLKFDNINLNDLTQETVSLMQAQANRGRVIIRTSLAPALPPVVADARSVRQILLNLMSNSIKFTGVGGQVIVSTTLTDHGEAVLRVRDTGVGMTENEIASALEPFRQLETSARGNAGGTGLGLPLTKALAEANRAQFAIKSSVNSGTLVEVAFPTSPTPPQ